MADKLDDAAPFNDDEGARIAREPTGAGAEAAEGIHGVPKGNGSEPPESGSHEHESGYGGKGGVPKSPNDGPDGRR